MRSRAYLRGAGVHGIQTPHEIFRFFLKSEGKELEIKRKKGMLGVDIFSSGVEIFLWGVEKFSGGLRYFRGGG